jgi:hypothetical protein
MKRFTETNKWRDAWFRRLSAGAKLAWVYITENCDAVGMIEIDLGLLSEDCSVKLNPGHISELGSRLIKIGEGRFFIPKFIHFQYGELSEKCPPHRTIMRLIEVHKLQRDGLLYRHPAGVETASAVAPVESSEVPKKPLPVNYPPVRPPDVGPRSSALEIYDAYPRKLGRKDALVAITKALTKMDAPKLLEVTRSYAAAVQGEDMKFIPYPASWFNAEHFFDDPAMWTCKPGVAPNKPLSIFEMKTVLEAKQKSAQDLKNAFASEGPLSTDWNNDEAKEKFKALRREIADLTRKIATSA